MTAKSYEDFNQFNLIYRHNSLGPMQVRTLLEGAYKSFLTSRLTVMSLVKELALYTIFGLIGVFLHAAITISGESTAWYVCGFLVANLWSYTMNGIFTFQNSDGTKWVEIFYCSTRFAHFIYDGLPHN